MINEDALQAASKESAIEAAKLIPGMGSLIEGIRKYHEHIEEEQRALFIAEIADRLRKLEDTFNKEWYNSEEGQILTKKLIASALNAEYADKIAYFANALINVCHANFEQNRNKFIEILRKISFSSLELLAKEKILHEKRGSNYSPEVLLGELVKITNWDPYLVESCVKELYSLGVFSSSTGFHVDGRKNAVFSEGIPAFTSYTTKFIQFIRNPTLE